MTNSKSTNWIQTYTGKQLDFTNIRSEDITIMDIAHGLSNICRYSGQSQEFYSVAQHCVLAVNNVHNGVTFPEYFTDQDVIDLKKCILLHDATEAYMSDISRPLKSLLSQYTDLEEKLNKAILDKFGITEEMRLKYLPFVHDIDMRMLYTEKQFVFKKNLHWNIDTTKYAPLPMNDFPFWAPVVAKRRFMERFNELFIAPALVKDVQLTLF